MSLKNLIKKEKSFALKTFFGFITYKLGNPALPGFYDTKVYRLNQREHSPSYPVKIWDILVQGFLSYDRTFKQKTDRQTEISTLDIYVDTFLLLMSEGIL